MWGCFSGEAQKTPPQNRPTTVISNQPEYSRLELFGPEQSGPEQSGAELFGGQFRLDPKYEY
jgi:hypothetical protein